MLRAGLQRSLGWGVFGLLLGITGLLAATGFTRNDVSTTDGIHPVARGDGHAYTVARVFARPGGYRSGHTPVAGAVPYMHRWTMDIFLLGLVLASTVWIGMLLWVQKDADELYEGQSQPVKLCNTIVLLVPGLGFLLYLEARLKRLQKQGRVPVLAKWKWLSWFRRRDPSPTRLRSREEALMLAFLDVDGKPIPIRRRLPGMSGVGTARELLAEAIVQRASDVHIEPRERGWRVRFRIDGVLQERPHLVKSDTLRMVASLKTLASIDVAEKRKAQDGRFGVQTSHGQMDLRVATTTSIHGEKLVMRILDRKTGLLGLTELGMPTPMLGVVNQVIRSHSGIILVTGPTGSGKTTTLYAALNQLDRTKLNIMTIEDPVEYELDGATQIPVNPRAGLTYASGLRSILRQDPDVILVGEMRDEEAAKIAIRSALTGHLVFSTLHTNNASGAIVRLMEIGIEKYQIVSSLLLVVAQRLVRVLCQGCREPYEPAAATLEELGLTRPVGGQIYRARGCEHCSETGYLGRTAIFELLLMDDALRQTFQEEFNEQKLWALARRQGARTLREAGAQKVLAGITTIDEVLQAQ